MNFQPAVYVSTGAKSGFYTLRRVNEFEDRFIRNLSTDPDKANEKIKRWENLGFRILNGADFDLEDWTPFYNQNVAAIEYAKLIQIVDFGDKLCGKYFGSLKNGQLKWIMDTGLLSDQNGTMRMRLLNRLEVAAIAIKQLIDSGILEYKDPSEERLERMAERKAQSEPVIEGRIQISGEVVSIKEQESIYGITTKMLVRDDRKFNVWGTVPSSIYDVEVGQRVEFTATVEASTDDETFGFYKRPSKAKLMEEA